jgi:hypothetical protein
MSFSCTTGSFGADAAVRTSLGCGLRGLRQNIHAQQLAKAIANAHQPAVMLRPHPFLQNMILQYFATVVNSNPRNSIFYVVLKSELTMESF